MKDHTYSFIINDEKKMIVFNADEVSVACDLSNNQYQMLIQKNSDQSVLNADHIISDSRFKYYLDQCSIELKYREKRQETRKKESATMDLFNELSKNSQKNTIKV